MNIQIKSAKLLQKFVRLETCNNSVKLFSMTSSKLSDPVVIVKQGKLKGAQSKLQDGSDYYSFKGIRYAEVPLRFSAPTPTKPWDGVYDATKHGPVCPQYDMTLRTLVEGSEDCLFLNVYTKSLQRDAKLPVIVFIHGGAYMSGSGNSDSGLGPDWLIQHDVILVTINYRLEMFGFLCLDTPEVPGNVGLKDQIAALKWVQENIEKFGGDPNNVTLMGESAGASSDMPTWTFHMQSPVSKGLFHKAIAQSGVNVVDWALGKDSKERAFRAAKHLGNDSKDTKEILNFLRGVPAIKLARITTRSMTEDESRRGLPIHFAPVVEKEFEGVEQIIKENPIDALAAGKVAKVPLLLGYNSDEAIFMATDMIKKLEFVNKNPKYHVPRELAETMTEDKQTEFGKRIRKFYIQDRNFTAKDSKAIGDMLSDTHFVHCANRFANFYSTLAPTYLYKFSIDTEFNIIKKTFGFSHLPGAAHAEDLFYLFKNDLNVSFYEKNKELQDIVFRITKLWTDFAKTGNPTPDNFHGVQWPVYNPSSREYFHIDKAYSASSHPDKQRVDFWNKLYKDAGRPCLL